MSKKSTAEKMNETGKKVQKVGCLLTLIITIPLLLTVFFGIFGFIIGAIIFSLGLVSMFQTKKPPEKVRVKRITVEEEEDNDEDEDEEEYKVVGVTFDNKDGKSRQAILKKCSVGDPVQLKLTTYKGKPAVEVWTDYGQIGNISSDDSEEVTDKVNEGKINIAEISGIFGGTKDKPTIGCAIISA